MSLLWQHGELVQLLEWNFGSPTVAFWQLDVRQ